MRRRHLLTGGATLTLAPISLARSASASVDAARVRARNGHPEIQLFGQLPDRTKAILRQRGFGVAPPGARWQRGAKQPRRTP
jgi:hypothetical protein